MHSHRAVNPWWKFWRDPRLTFINGSFDPEKQQVEVPRCWSWLIVLWLGTLAALGAHNHYHKTRDWTSLAH